MYGKSIYFNCVFVFPTYFEILYLKLIVNIRVKMKAPYSLKYEIMLKCLVSIKYYHEFFDLSCRIEVSSYSIK